jgi:hypothetical protein
MASLDPQNDSHLFGPMAPKKLILKSFARNVHHAAKPLYQTMETPVFG